ncbi:MAG: hypothetical protein HY072_03970, partial [Deltaproteobacteria bacterium]|nr:hypothetical protein [Deltaproteobacteria bacterium]
GAAGNLKDGLLGKLNEQQQKVVEMLSANCVRLGRLINDLLDLSRLESGKAKVHKGQLDVPKLINETLATFQAQAQEKLITVSPQEKLPPVYADSDMIIQVLMNLINNSRRFAKSKVVVSSALCVMDNKAQSVSLSSKYDAVLVTVEDDGEGITLEDQAKLFNKFEQVNRPHGGAGYKGTGLGLSICREIIHLHGGSISVDSKLGNGTRFCFALPLYDETIFFHDSLRKSYAEAQKAEEPLSLVYCAIQNGAELKTKMGSNLKAILNTWAETLRKETLRKNDSLFVLEDGMSIVIVAPTAKTVAAVISERVLEKTRAWDFVMHAATASYPEDATNVQELLSHLGIGRNK